jgi:hypothetical protein
MFMDLTRNDNLVRSAFLSLPHSILFLLPSRKEVEKLHKQTQQLAKVDCRLVFLFLSNSVII